MYSWVSGSNSLSTSGSTRTNALSGNNPIYRQVMFLFQIRFEGNDDWVEEWMDE